MGPWEAGPAGRWEPIPGQSVSGPPGAGRHVSAPALPATHSVGSMSAAAVARKRGKPASGARAGAGAGKRRRKVSMALLRAGVRPATGPTFILSYPHLDPLPGLSPGTPSWSGLHHSLCPKTLHWSRGAPPYPVPGLSRDRKGPSVNRERPRPLTKKGSYNSQADSAGDRGKSKGGGKMNEEISSDSESER